MKTEKELGEALKNNQDEITIEGDLVKKVIRIHATGNVAWAVAFAAIAIAIAATLSMLATGGTDAPVAGPTSLVTGTVAASALGLPTTISAVAIGVAAGGAGALNKLRSYKLVKISDQKIILRKRK